MSRACCMESIWSLVLCVGCRRIFYDLNRRGEMVFWNYVVGVILFVMEGVENSYGRLFPLWPTCSVGISTSTSFALCWRSLLFWNFTLTGSIHLVQLSTGGDLDSLFLYLLHATHAIGHAWDAWPPCMTVWLTWWAWSSDSLSCIKHQVWSSQWNRLILISSRNTTWCLFWIVHS